MLDKGEWFKFLSGGQKALVEEAYDLLKQFKGEEYEDYSFVVFPMAKAYEGFLKKYFLETGLIDRGTYDGDRFRIGKALNPSMPVKHRGNWWLWDDLVQKCGGEKVPNILWKAWRECRNRIFHYFPGHTEAISLSTAGQKIDQLKIAMESILKCEVG